MNTPPPDWNDDRRLWDLLDKAPNRKPPSNFAHMVRQRLATETAPARRGFSPFAWFRTSPFQGFAFGLGAVAACVLLMVFFTAGPAPRDGSPRAVQYAANDTGNGNGDFSQAAPDFELIQDMEVIEHLDEL